MILVDSNVLIDVLNVDEAWHIWSRACVDRLNRDDMELAINEIILAEIASNFETVHEAGTKMDSIDVEIVPIGESAAFAAGHAFRDYRRSRLDRGRVLADFLIGAHAMSLGAALLTHDPTLYRRYFPDLTLITPETHP